MQDVKVTQENIVHVTAIDDFLANWAQSKPVDTTVF